MNDYTKIGKVIVTTNYILRTLRFVAITTVIIIAILLVLRLFDISIPLWSAPIIAFVIRIAYRLLWQGFFRLMMKFNSYNVKNK